jgi:hypothetical protein
MKDLANEREAVREKLLEFNFEPVNAEDLGPTGGNSWERIQPEIESSNLVVLLLGERYGWIPKTGPKADLGLSITELEAEEARRLDIPILPFIKRLDEDADRTSEDAQRRAKFRSKLMDWDNGQFVQQFERALELAEKVGRAVITLLTDQYSNRRMARRAESASYSAQLLQTRRAPLLQAIRSAEPVIQPDLPTAEVPASAVAEGGPPQAGEPLSIPPGLIDALKRREVVLFAGSGVSMAAGLPSTAAFSERLCQFIREKEPDYNLSAAASAFAAIATDLETLRGRQYVIEAIGSLVHPPNHPEPTLGHATAVRLFPQIITTNFDRLFERAAVQLDLPKPNISTEITDAALPSEVIVKLHGSYDAPDSLVITERDIAMLDKDRRCLWQAMLTLLRLKTIVVVGSSLRDPSIVRLFAEVGERLPGYFVCPKVPPSTAARLHRWNLECIETASNDFFAALSTAAAQGI